MLKTEGSWKSKDVDRCPYCWTPLPHGMLTCSPHAQKNKNWEWRSYVPPFTVQKAGSLLKPGPGSAKFALVTTALSQLGQRCPG